MALSREEAIAHSIQHSLLERNEKPGLLGKIPAAFNTTTLTFDCISPDLFRSLRQVWQVSEKSYAGSFTADDSLVAMGDIGFSGSTFFHTKDGKYLVKSVPRQFEHSFFKDDLLEKYVDYMFNNATSLLIRITDFLEHSQHSLGSVIGTAPSHHLVMENIMFGKEEGEKSGKWKNWDLKPMSYFFPERDIAGGALTNDETKEKLADEFKDKLVLTLDQAEDFKAQLAKDTKLLSDCDAVDYSLFLVRIPLVSIKANASSDGNGTDGNLTIQQPDGLSPPHAGPFIPPSPPSWRTGIPSSDGKYAYRAAILDFFWSKHKVYAKAMTGLISAYNVVDKQGHMSITTTAPEYRERFLKMCWDMIEVREG
ncbi:hypothetical protein LTR78_008629 [Recurvomyces mirabilis]|uniref:PIPK domain-containing protein n=1 Tax=Recurvomyces mirabilis TaxID=574656 RepID=A0AAE0TTI9_9PEZI|nr:hypothetical protein LTR78_008629 [Recurvomyces mirabilis]KAK5153460.1 hypothetical protein LTS14_007630 [Recurvomyces mirabilis]